MPQLHGVVFDVAGVLIDWDPRHLYRKLFPSDPEGMELFLATVCSPEWRAEQDRGRPYAVAVAELSARFPEHAGLIAAYDERWEEMTRGPIPGVPEVLAELRAAEVRCFGLTNFSVEKFALTRRRFDFLDLLQGIVLSGEEGVCKPDPEIYKRLIARFRLEPPRFLFVDDRPANVAAATRVGFSGYRFTSAEGLRADLTRRGLLI